ncbi:tRNA pseudouridine(38-40) synthase TruA [Synechococcus sp. CCY9201]|uniref:tRNA pseudouridine(38-40) synthase TruA n=1 Tax=unclassified Synechococcus TaxID=2626047 RepID=UPI002AD5A35A|nr:MULTISPECIES: tRNA pseudouridine(38-40) synthase TruA [unclassified Synechococcus]MEA5474430.1 tRNA pseudouridine(38-40) synthase TruA [Synechococcus sp. CCY9201]CAK6701368.1 tRNA pseudouridine synthase A [Synechococcus sp. CBW1107]
MTGLKSSGQPSASASTADQTDTGSANREATNSEATSGEHRRRIALCLQYDGAAFCGWQRQPRHPSVQQTLEEAIASLDPPSLDSQRPVRTMAAGRTDSGVHAAGQVAHFETSGPIPAQRWPKALNGRLPASIRVVAAAEVPLTWHACFSATYRRYRYTIHNGRTPNLFLAPWTWHRYQQRLDEQAMADALAGMLGDHDFSAFQRAGSSRPHARTTLQEVMVDRQGDLVVVEMQATGFLYGMVRLVMGQLVAVGEGQLSVDGFSRRWRQQAREQVKEAAPPQGLCLLRVGYPEEVFVKSAWYDGQPRFALAIPDSP